MSHALYFQSHYFVKRNVNKSGDAAYKYSMLLYYDSRENITPKLIGNDLSRILCGRHANGQHIVILCIGSDRSTGDCLGPLIGYKLAGIFNENDKVAVLGTLNFPVHAVNLSETIRYIYNEYDNPYVIAIDASLGRRDHIGYITLGTGALRPGLGVKKRLPSVGDIHITGIVNLSGGADTVVLQTTRLSTIMMLADAIATGLAHGIKRDIPIRH